MKKLKRKTHKRNKTIPAIIGSCLALILLFGGLFLAKNPEILKAITGQQEIMDASPFNVRPFEDSEKGKPFREKKYNHLVDAKKEDLGVDVTPVPHRFLDSPPSGTEDGNYFIEGEYAFFPKWRKDVTKAVVVHNGEKKIYDEKKLGGTAKFTKADIDTNPNKNYVVFTHMGLYKGKPVSVKMTPIEVPKTVTIGLDNIPLVQGKDIKIRAAMSISETGKPDDGGVQATYVKVKYSFYDCTGEDITGEKLDFGEPIKVKGFLTYIDFDNEESIGFNKNAKMQRAYFVKGDKDDPDYMLEPPISNVQDYYNYLVRYKSPLTDHFVQLLYKKADDYLFINRGWRTNTNAATKGNWFQFTYGETEEFDVVVSAPAFNHEISYRGYFEGSGVSPGSLVKFKARDDESVNDGRKEFIDFYLANPNLFTTGSSFNREHWGKWDWQSKNTTGSTVGFAPETLLPILFPNPVKIADQNTKDDVITWEINQGIPARKFKNAEPQFIVTDEIDECLSIGPIKIKDAGGRDVTDDTIDGKKCWNITKKDNKITIEASKEFLTDPNEEFYANNFIFEIKTTLNRSKDYMTHFDKDEGSLLFYNQSKLTTKFLDMTDRVIESKPGYDEPVGKTEGRIDLAGNLKIIKVEKGTGTKLEGAEFELYDENDKTKSTWKGKTDNKGILVIPTDGTDIKGGSYTLKEVKPPIGYEDIADREVVIGLGTKEVTIENEKTKEIGKFAKPVKEVLNESGTGIDGERVSRGEILTYKITVKDDGKKADSLIKKVVLTDTLDENLELIPNSTYITLPSGLGPVIVSDSDVWSTVAGKKKLKTLEEKLKQGEELKVEWKVKVKKTATVKIENEGTVTGEGYEPGQNTPKEISETTNKVVNYLATPINLRQIIVTPHLSLVVPKAPTDETNKEEQYGFFQLNNLNAAGKSVEQLNVMVHSDEGITKTVYTEVSIMPKDNNLIYSIVPVLPEMYKITGYAHTTVKNQTKTDIKPLVSGYPELTIEDGKEHFITIILEPTLKKEERPPFYNWDYQLNVFPKEIVSE